MKQIETFCFRSDNMRTKLKRFGFVPIISFDIETRVADLHLLHPDPDLIRIQGFNVQKLRKKITAKKNLIFWDQKLQFTYPQASIKHVQVTKEAFSSQRRPSNTSKHQLKNFFLLLGVIFALLDPDPDSGSGSTDPIECGSNPFPQPAVWTCMAYPFPSPAVWLCRVYPFRSQQFGRAGRIPFNHELYGRARCTLGANQIVLLCFG